MPACPSFVIDGVDQTVTGGSLRHRRIEGLTIQTLLWLRNLSKIKPEPKLSAQKSIGLFQTIPEFGFSFHVLFVLDKICCGTEKKSKSKSFSNVEIIWCMKKV